jgi:hypothetical protein
MIATVITTEKMSAIRRNMAGAGMVTAHADVGNRGVASDSQRLNNASSNHPLADECDHASAPRTQAQRPTRTRDNELTNIAVTNRLTCPKYRLKY